MKAKRDEGYCKGCTSVNNKCKSFTSLEQSKVLAEILPLESADMYYEKKM